VSGLRQENELNAEHVISLSPDLVVVANWSDSSAVSQLRAAGVPVYLIESGRTVEQIAGKIRRLALLTGDGERGESIVREMNRRVAEVARRVSAVPPARRKSILDYSVWGGAMGRGSTWDEVVRRAGLVNAVGEFNADQWGQVPLSREKILQLDPDILALPGWIFGDPEAADRFASEVLKDPAFSLLKAVRRGSVLRVPGTFSNTSSQYIAAAVEYLARAAYPELF
jgi:iron complex transport system substrate-binding protein